MGRSTCLVPAVPLAAVGPHCGSASRLQTVSWHQDSMSWAKSLVHQSPRPLRRLKPFPRPSDDGWLPGCRKGDIHAIYQRPLPSEPPSDPHLPASPLPPQGRVPCPTRLMLTVLICSLGFHLDPDLNRKQWPQPPHWLPLCLQPPPPKPLIPLLHTPCFSQPFSDPDSLVTHLQPRSLATAICKDPCPTTPQEGNVP